MKISGETMIFKNDKGYYETSISNKKEDGTYENMYVSVNFKKGIEVENKTKINILDGFLSFYKNKEGLPKIKLVILDFISVGQEIESDTLLDSSDLPF